jgi:hypothetical protein
MVPSGFMAKTANQARKVAEEAILSQQYQHTVHYHNTDNAL